MNRRRLSNGKENHHRLAFRKRNEYNPDRFIVMRINQIISHNKFCESFVNSYFSNFSHYTQNIQIEGKTNLLFLIEIASVHHCSVVPATYFF